RNNVRMIGLKEGLEAGGIVKCVNKILSEGLGINPDGEFEIERAHLAPASRPSADQPPRIVLIKFLRSSAREKVLQAAREKGMTEWEGCRFSPTRHVQRVSQKTEGIHRFAEDAEKSQHEIYTGISSLSSFYMAREE
ncbi:hypothetical protein HF521_015574, partial [Silurus meridionalis]